jgi:hypothetical protein
MEAKKGERGRVEEEKLRRRARAMAQRAQRERRRKEGRKGIGKRISSNI